MKWIFMFIKNINFIAVSICKSKISEYSMLDSKDLELLIDFLRILHIRALWIIS